MILIYIYILEESPPLGDASSFLSILAPICDNLASFCDTFGAQWVPLGSFLVSMCYSGRSFHILLNRWGLKGEHQTTSKAQLTTNCAYPDDLSNLGFHFLTYF